MAIPETQPPRANTDPTDKSSPCVIRIKVIPRAVINVNPVDRSTLNMLLNDKKTGLTMEIMPINKTVGIIIPLSLTANILETMVFIFLSVLISMLFLSKVIVTSV
jgi:hypothetical protein